MPLSATRIIAAFVTIYPRIGGTAGAPTQNVGQVRLGGKPSLPDNVTLNGASTAIPFGAGMPLNPGDAGVLWPMQASAPIDLNNVYLDVDNSGDGVQFIFGRP